MDQTKPAVIEIINASVKREGKNILENVSLTIREGENVAIIGPNGAGKSSIIKLITREYYPLQEEGKDTRVSVFGKTSWDLFELRSLMGIVSPELQHGYDRATIGRDVALSGFFSSAGIYSHHEITPELIKKVNDALEFLGIDRLADKPLSSMSAGEARKFLIARALVNDPRMLVLDEPTSGLDIKSTRDFLGVLRGLSAEGKKIIMVTHRINEIIPEIGRVVMVKDGKILADGPKEDVLTGALVSRLYDIDVCLEESHGYYSITYK